MRPFAGRIGITTVNPGQYLNPGDKIVTLQTMDPIYVDFFVPQKQIAGLTLGQTLVLSNDAYDGITFPGKISAINPRVDPATRNVQVRGHHRQPQAATAARHVRQRQRRHGREETLPDLAADRDHLQPVRLDRVRAEAGRRQGAKKDEKGNPQLLAQQVFVTTGPTRGDQVAILKGLSEGQLVVTSGQLKLKNGTPVVVDNTVQPANNPNPAPQEH